MNRYEYLKQMESWKGKIWMLNIIWSFLAKFSWRISSDFVKRECCNPIKYMCQLDKRHNKWAHIKFLDFNHSKRKIDWSHWQRRRRQGSKSYVISSYIITTNCVNLILFLEFSPTTDPWRATRGERRYRGVRKRILCLSRALGICE